ncbi:MAG: hypothetical protein JRJ38_16990 [Deltaproteobacteria bacterium]|nr:hypothetical protein [Deltaproteobacteria bacterium]
MFTVRWMGPVRKGTGGASEQPSSNHGKELPVPNEKWKAEMTTCHYDKTEVVSQPCEVLFINDRQEIAISYGISKENQVTYRGQEDGKGHYHLKADTVHGRASLHTFHDSTVLEGYWVEDGYEGMWRVELKMQET